VSLLDDSDVGGGSPVNAEKFGSGIVGPGKFGSAYIHMQQLSMARLSHKSVYLKRVTEDTLPFGDPIAAMWKNRRRREETRVCTVYIFLSE